MRLRLHELWFTGFAIAVTACSAESPTDVTHSVASSLGRTTEQDGACDAVHAGDGWVNTFMPQAESDFTIAFSAYPASSATPPLIDTVVGLSNGPADSFRDLGPIVRFNDAGTIDARDGSAYVGAFPYRTGDGPFEFYMDVSIPRHRYTVWVRHRDAIGKPLELLGQDLAFRTEQSTVMRLDNIGRFTDSAVGSVETCGFEYFGPDRCESSTAGAWVSRAFPARDGRIRVEFAVTTTSLSIDGVVGLSNGAPARFTDLAAIVRFRPDGTLDARNGPTYSRDVVVPYSQYQRFDFALDVDLPNGTYTAMVHNASHYGSPPVVFARDYAFRSEQANVASFDHLGQFVDQTAGELGVCELTVAY